jgi:UTP--glucose-1-phosphate uridylyltransferase
MNKKIKKALFPVAGFGVRFLPATKACPKEMLPVCDKPLIQYAVEEAVAAGITELIFITGRHKRAIEDHFDKSYELEEELFKKNKKDFLNIVQNIVPSNVNCIYIRQTDALGLGHAVFCARTLIEKDEAFAVILADDLLYHDYKLDPNNHLQEMMNLHYKTGASILGVQEVLPESVSLYGIVEPKFANDSALGKNGPILSIVEKPSINNAKSNLAVIGRYILTSDIFELITNVTLNKGEIQLTDAISKLIGYKDVYSYLINSKRYDCGSKLGYLFATVDYALRHKELAEEFKKYLLGIQIK